MEEGNLMCQKFGLINSTIHMSSKNRTKIISGFERKRLVIR
jgi:hypothetical protein